MPLLHIIETLWAEITLPNAKPFLISSVYRPPSACSDWISLFEEELSVAQTTGLEYILIGDFNIDIALSSNTTGWERTVHTTLCLDLYSEQILVSICRIGFKIVYFCVLKLLLLRILTSYQ